MAVTGGVGISRVLKDAYWYDFQSFMDYWKGKARVDLVHIEGRTTTDGALAEINFCVGDTINYIAAEGQCYIRCEADDANQHSKYVYLQYQDDTGAIQDWVTADLNAADSTTEVIVTGADDFYRIRQMYSEVESASGGGKAVILTDANMGGVDDIYGFINDGLSRFNLERFFTQPEATCDSYLVYVKWDTVPVAIGAGTDTFLSGLTFTPRALNGGEAEPDTDITLSYKFQDSLEIQPCYKLAGGSEVIFTVGDIATAGIVRLHAIMAEVYEP